MDDPSEVTSSPSGAMHGNISEHGGNRAIADTSGTAKLAPFTTQQQELMFLVALWLRSDTRTQAAADAVVQAAVRTSHTVTTLWLH